MRRRRRASAPTKHCTPGGTCTSRCEAPFIRGVLAPAAAASMRLAPGEPARRREEGKPPLRKTPGVLAPAAASSMRLAPGEPARRREEGKPPLRKTPGVLAPAAASSMRLAPGEPARRREEGKPPL